MKLLNILFIGLALCLSAMSCNKDKLGKQTIEFKGTILKQGITTYQYGTHTASTYALRSEELNLDDFLNQEVKIVGKKIEGYPVDGGPEYIEVTKIN